MTELPTALVLVGLGPDEEVPLAGRERADRALLEARRAGIRVVHVTAPDGDGAPAAGAGYATVALTPGDQVSEERLVAALGPRPAEVAVAGTGSLLADVVHALGDSGADIVVLEDACTDIGTGRRDRAVRRLASGAHLLTTSAWIDGFGAGRRPSRNRIISLAAFSVAIILIVVAIVWAEHEAHDLYVLSPGSAPLLTDSRSCQAHGSSDPDLVLPGGQPCARIDVPAGRAHHLTGALHMVDVLESQASWSEWLEDKLGVFATFHGDSALFPASSILGSTPADQLNCQNDQEMAQATTDAPVVALQRLGYDVHERDFGAQVDLVMPGYPAAAAGIACNDVIDSVNGHPTPTVQAVTGQLAGMTPGETVALGVSPGTGSPGTARTRTVNVKLTSTPASAGPSSNPRQGFLGVELQTRSTFELPFNVTVNVGDIGGPSAGLAITLGIIDLLSSGKLTGGHPVAATGTINPDGSVGDVGGVAQKAVAVYRAGARTFLVPPQEVKAAESHDAGGRLRVIGVSSLSQALAVLARLGGTVPPPVPAGSATTGGG